MATHTANVDPAGATRNWICKDEREEVCKARELEAAGAGRSTRKRKAPVRPGEERRN